MSTNRPVLVIGGINRDEILWLDHTPGDDSTVEVLKRIEANGGHAANCASALARLGTEVWLAGSVGRDAAGESVIAALQEAGINTTLVNRCGQRSTGRVTIPQSDGLRFMMMERGANLSLNAEWARKLPVDEFETVIMFDPPKSVLGVVLSRRRTSRLVWCPGGYWARRRAEAPPALVDDLVLNRSEAEAWFGVPVVRGGKLPVGFDADEPGRVVVTFGANGVSAWEATGCSTALAFNSNADDPTGAGDAFVAAFVHAAALRCVDCPAPLEQQLLFANQAAAIAAEGAGAQGGLPTTEAVIARACAADFGLDWSFA